MSSFFLDGLKITPLKKGADEFSKVSYPLRYGQYGEIKSEEYIYQFNLNGEIKYIKGIKSGWPHPSEWLKRTVTNDWLYYSTGGYSGTLEYSGEFYVPCMQYRTNSIILMDPFETDEVRSAIDSFYILHDLVAGISTEGLQPEIKRFMEKIKRCSPDFLCKNASCLKNILNDRITVLPPDSRHVDYEVIPVIIADGCLYRCGFCGVKSTKKFSIRSENNIKDQIKKLKNFYGADIVNYNSIFLAQHDALNAGIKIIEDTVLYAFETLGLKLSNIKGANLFLFGSVDSLLKSDEYFFERLNKLQFMTYINVGLESVDRKTLMLIKKDISPSGVEEAFSKIVYLNRKYENLELTSNFLLSDRLPENHYQSIFKLIDKYVSGFLNKGVVYFSPMFTNSKEGARGIKRNFFEIKRRLPVPSFLYLIQRL